jgi:glycosyltransferase involved in cell wall biosynthesis
MITLSMIVKNEEKYLKDCLLSVRDIVDEIIIVDTGSVDNTISIAKEFGAKLFHFKWIDDFSAARNFALENSASDWILYLDADERLSENSVSEIKEITKLANKCAYFCKVKSINEISGKSSVMDYVRLFPNDKTIKFEGKIHEQIEEPLRKAGYSIKKSNIEIIHIGYNLAEDGLKEKAKRNLQILLSEYRNNPSSYYAYQLGQTYGVLNDKQNAEKYFLISLQNEELKNEYRSVANRYLAVNYAERNEWNTALNYITQSLLADSTQPTALLVAAKISFHLDNEDDAKSYCKKAYLMNEEYLSGSRSSHQSILLDRSTIINEGINIAASLNERELFKFFYDKSVRINSNPSNENIKADLYNKLFTDLTLDNEDMNNISTIINSNEEVETIMLLLDNYNNMHAKVKLLELIYGKFPENTGVLNNLALVYEKNNDLKKAENLLEKSFELDNKDPAIVFYLISIYLKNANFSKIVTIMEFAEENFKNEPIVIQKIDLLKEKLVQFIN